ncbi:3-carboxy-cis,cis-muconate cycloisomerase [Paucibacter sp. KBW04]|uniref:lyase family protein n=1 Tax=Paucibacter sp. KBW04 TaxID=2153361 RepID=UPI000F569DA4|nr:lyase family protein [Paucibacter sp. KBW04]RQO63063.1 3-carboxy-cis,cis-muconate cycloisomerase [Paucibacter sp. KBW04]
MSVLVFEGFLSTPEMLKVLDQSSIVQSMMDFEAALAKAQGRVGVIPASAAQAIASLCRAELYDINALVAASARDGSLAIPVVRRLAETVALFDPVAAGFVHWGATSQDVIDSSQILLTRRALQLIEDDLLQLISLLLDLADAHPVTPVLARTLLQAAQVSSLRFRLAAWVLPLLRAAQALRHAADAALQLQFGGAVGTLSALGEQADAVSAALASELRLPVPEMPWHSQRDRMVRLCAELGVLCGSLGKLARDISLLSQTEIAEMVEPDGASPTRPRSPSRAMPHKRNPVYSMLALAAGQRAPQRVAALLGSMVQEFERGLGGWQAELAETVSLLMHTHGSVRAMVTALSGLKVYPERMRLNVEAQHGLVFAEGLTMLLAGPLGRLEAQSLVEGLCAQVQEAEEGEGPEEGHNLAAAARALVQRDERLRDEIRAAELDAVFDVERVAAQADQRVAKALAQAREGLTALQDEPHW